MSSHFTAIGFDIETQQDLHDLLNKLSSELKEVIVPDGVYLIWRSKSGAELWFQLKGKNLIGLNPHFRGRSVFNLGLVKKVEMPDETKLEGSLYAWVNPDEKIEGGEYPFLFDVPDYGAYPDLGYPCVAKAQVAAFAHDLRVYENEEAFDAGQTGEIRYAPQSFIPTGLFTVKTGGSGAPGPYAMLNGRVVESGIKKNEITGKEFTWALVESLGGKFDVIVDSGIYSGKLEIGNIVSGLFWMTGRLITYQRVKKGLIDRLFS